MTIIISCEQCQTRYAVQADTIPPEGRMVRCAKCAHNWMQKPPEKEPEEVPARATDMREFSFGNDAYMPEEHSTPVLLKILPFVLIIGNLWVTMVYYKDTILEKIPAAHIVYEVIGDVPVDGMRFDKVTFKKVKDDDGHTNVYITMGISNGLTTDQPLPKIRFQEKDRDQKVLGEQLADNGNTVIKPGETFTEKPKIPVALGAEYVVLDIGNKWDYRRR